VVHIVTEVGVADGVNVNIGETK